MQADEEVGKIAHAVPVIISRTLELFVESLLTKSSQITLSRNSKTLSPSHLKQCIMSESRFDFLKDLVKNVPDISNDDGSGSTSEEQHNPEQTSVPASCKRKYSLCRVAFYVILIAMVIFSDNGVDTNGSSGAVVARIYQRSQSFQPSTSSQSEIPHYHNPTIIQQKQFYLNSYTTISKQNNTKQPNPNMNIPQVTAENHCPIPAKITRFNSLPSSTITSEQQQQQLQQQQSKQSIAPIEFPIQITYNVDGKTTSTESPTVKIDYSKLPLPSSPAIKIDLSSFNTPLTTTSIQQPSNQPTATLDEDYDA